MSDRTLAEAFRELDRITRHCSERSAQHVHIDTYAAHREADLRRITLLEDRLQWAWRAAITGLVMPVVVGLMVAVMIYGGAQ